MLPFGAFGFLVVLFLHFRLLFFTFCRSTIAKTIVHLTSGGKRLKRTLNRRTFVSRKPFSTISPHKIAMGLDPFKRDDLALRRKLPKVNLPLDGLRKILESLTRVKSSTSSLLVLVWRRLARTHRKVSFEASARISSHLVPSRLISSHLISSSDRSSTCSCFLLAPNIASRASLRPPHVLWIRLSDLSLAGFNRCAPRRTCDRLEQVTRLENKSVALNTCT